MQVLEFWSLRAPRTHQQGASTDHSSSRTLTEHETERDGRLGYRETMHRFAKEPIGSYAVKQ